MTPETQKKISPLKSFLIGCCIGGILIVAGSGYIVYQTHLESQKTEEMSIQLREDVLTQINQTQINRPFLPPKQMLIEQRQNFVVIQNALIQRYPDIWQDLTEPKAVYHVKDKMADQIRLIHHISKDFIGLLLEQNLSIQEHAWILTHILKSASDSEESISQNPPPLSHEILNQTIVLTRFYYTFYKIAHVPLPSS